MLTEAGYLIAMLVYLLAGLAGVVLFARWLTGRSGWRVFWVLTGAALLMTPALPRPGMDTLAPALVVAGFQLATEGLEASMHALRPLAAALIAAWVLAILTGLVLRRRPG
jgi:hypothetical protein